MARFYKTASANPLEYMHRMNLPLLKESLFANDEYITQNLNQNQQINDFDFAKLAPDNERAAEIMQGYKTKAEEYAKAIQQDPSNWRNQAPQIKSLAQDLASNYKNGEISKIVGNYNTYKDWETNIDKQVEQWNKYGGTKGGLDPETAKAAKNHYLNNWIEKRKNTDYKSGTDYNPLQVEDVMSNMDVNKILGENLKDMKASGALTESTTMPGMYIVKTTNGEKTVSADRLMSAIWENFTAKPELKSYLLQQEKFGRIGGVSKDGQMINPYKTIKDKEGKEIETWNDESYLSPIMKGLLSKYGYRDIVQKMDIKGDPVKMQTANMANQRGMQNQRLATQKQLAIMKENGLNSRFNTKLDWDKMKFDLQQKAKNGDKVASKKLEDINAMEYIGEINNPDNNFEDDGTEVNTNRANPNIPDDGKTHMYATPETLATTPNGRFKTSLETAKKSVINDFGTEGQEYVDFLGERKHTPELAREFLAKTKHIYEKPNSQRSAWDKTTGGNRYENDNGWLPWSDASGNGETATYEKFKKIGDKFNKGIDSWYKENNQKNSKIDIHPFSSDVSPQIVQAINNSKSNYFTIDEQGRSRELSSLGDIKTIVGGTGGNAQSNMGYQVEMPNGVKKYIFPKQGDQNVANINMYYGLMGAKDKNSAYALELKNRVANDVKTTLMQGIKVNNGINNVITLGDKKLPATLHDNGSVTLKDTDGNEIGTFSSIYNLIESSTNK